MIFRRNLLILTNNSIYYKVFIILSLAIFGWYFFTPQPGLSEKAIHMLIVFVAVMISAMLEIYTPVLLFLIGIVVLNLTNTIDVKQSFRGFSNIIPWLLFSILSLAKAITKTTLGLRIAYIFMRFFGRGIIGLSYSIILTEVFVAPFMPSNTARVASIGLPLVKSLSKYVSSNVKGVSEKAVGGYLSILCTASCAVCSAMYATGMVSNALILDIATAAGVGITWISWLKFTILPCAIILLLLPVIISAIIKPNVKSLETLREQAARNYKQLGSMTKEEKFIAIVFTGMLLMWIFSKYIGVPILVTALIGLCIFLIFGTLDVKDILSNDSAFNSVMIIGLLMSYVNNMTSLGVIDWFTGVTSGFVGSLNKEISFFALAIIYFFAAYFFSGESGKVTALYAPFLATGLTLGVDKTTVAMTLAVFSALPDVLTHYTAPISILMFSSGYVSARKWASTGIALAVIIMLIWFSYVWFLIH
ncbi:MAG: anion permease [Holosporales bacterium]|nr:anion permease [Holosporales bacterium]